MPSDLAPVHNPAPIAGNDAWADASATVAEVAEEMMERYIRHVLVEEDGELIGVVSARDLLGAYASSDPFREQVPTRWREG